MRLNECDSLCEIDLNVYQKQPEFVAYDLLNLDISSKHGYEHYYGLQLVFETSHFSSN